MVEFSLVGKGDGMGKGKGVRRGIRDGSVDDGVSDLRDGMEKEERMEDKERKG